MTIKVWMTCYRRTGPNCHALAVDASSSKYDLLHSAEGVEVHVYLSDADLDRLWDGLSVELTGDQVSIDTVPDGQPGRVRTVRITRQVQ